jgi:hypothetical protein
MNLGSEEEKKTESADQTHFEHDGLIETMKSGANWFYWIAGLSVVNTIIYISGADWSFLAGLGLTQLADGFVDVAIDNGAPSMLKAVAIVFDFVVVAIFGFFGYYAGKRSSVVFIIGIVIYVLDGLLLLLIGVWPSAGFHAFALFFIIRGFMACRSLNAFEANRPFQPPPPAPAGA